MISDRADGTGHAPHHAASSMLHITRICAALVLLGELLHARLAAAEGGTPTLPALPLEA